MDVLHVVLCLTVVSRRTESNSRVEVVMTSYLTDWKFNLFLVFQGKNVYLSFLGVFYVKKGFFFDIKSCGDVLFWGIFISYQFTVTVMRILESGSPYTTENFRFRFVNVHSMEIKERRKPSSHIST